MHFVSIIAYFVRINFSQGDTEVTFCPCDVIPKNCSLFPNHKLNQQNSPDKRRQGKRHRSLLNKTGRRQNENDLEHSRLQRKNRDKHMHDIA